MANSADSENKTDTKTWAESLTERLKLLEDSATQSSRIAARSSKRKRAVINAHMRDTLQSFHAQEAQLQVRAATVENRETELVARQELLNQLEQRLEEQLERLSTISKETAPLELPTEFGDEVAQRVAATMERQMAELLNSQAAAYQGSQALEQAHAEQLALLAERSLKAEGEHQLLQARAANIEEREAELVARHEMLNKLEQRLEEQLERLATISTEPAPLELPTEFGDEVAQRVAVTMERQMAELLSSQAAEHQGSQALEQAHAEQLALLTERSLKAESENQILQARAATVEKTEAELVARQELLNKLEQRLEEQLERLATLSSEPAPLELPTEFGDEVAQRVAVTMERQLERQMAELLNSQVAEHQGSQVLEQAHAEQLALLTERSLKAEGENQLLQAQAATVQKTEAELAHRQELLNKLEQRLEEQLERLALLSTDSGPLELPAEFGEEMAQRVAVTMELQLERHMAELLNSQAAAHQGSQALEQAHAEKFAFVKERAVQAEDENQRLKQELAEVRDEIGSYRKQLQEQLAMQSSCDTEELIKQLQNDLSETRELLSTKTELSESLDKEMAAKIAGLRQDLGDAEEFARLLQVELVTAKEAGSIAVTNAESTESELIKELQDEIVSLQTTLMASRADSQAQQVATSADSDHLACELYALKQQNADLEAQLARLQQSVSKQASYDSLCQESMSWEQRKQLILRQLEEEEGTDESSPALEKKRTEIAEVLAVTQTEIERRDREIKELQSIVEQQSNARAGVAIGAAAIAQMFDGDELIKQERERLKAIQEEWQDKMRKVEIEMSLERAKLGRERAQLEEQLRAREAESTSLASILESRAEKSSNKVEIKSAGKPSRKWLEHLGLKDKDKDKGT